MTCMRVRNARSATRPSLLRPDTTRRPSLFRFRMGLTYAKRSGSSIHFGAPGVSEPSAPMWASVGPVSLFASR